MGLIRRRLLKGGGWALFSTLASGGYAFSLEPFSLRIQRYRLTPAGWPSASARHLVVSGGLGCPIMPVRVGIPPEITVVELRA
jgi:hypothetical protein